MDESTWILTQTFCACNHVIITNIHLLFIILAYLVQIFQVDLSLLFVSWKCIQGKKKKKQFLILFVSLSFVDINLVSLAGVFASPGSTPHQQTAALMCTTLVSWFEPITATVLFFGTGFNQINLWHAVQSQYKISAVSTATNCWVVPDLPVVDLVQYNTCNNL